MGLFGHWALKVIPNVTACINAPSTITINTSLAITNLWVTLTLLSFAVFFLSLSFLYYLASYSKWLGEFAIQSEIVWIILNIFLYALLKIQNFLL